MSAMASMLIVAHSPLDSALLSVAHHAFPERVSDVAALDVVPGDSLEDIELRLRALLSQRPECLILADVFGATPCNAALRVTDSGRVRVVSGVNVPMLWRALSYVDEPLEALVARAVTGAVQGVMQLASTRPQNQSPKATQDDSVNPHHQQ